MAAAYAAAYCGEPSVEAFMARVGTEYPVPVIDQGRRRLWLKDHLDHALTLQLPFPQVSESMGNHDSEIVGADGVD